MTIAIVILTFSMELDMINVIKELKRQPIFQLSLADKELFHSNFLAWIATEYPDFFLLVLENMKKHESEDDITTDWYDDFRQNKLTVKREYNNFDLCILNGKSEPVFVLENKNKSIPYLNQLRRYNAKLKGYQPERLLLCLAEEIPDRKSITEAGWEIVSYTDLAAAMKTASIKLPSNIDPYHKSLIDDYQQFVYNLSELAHKLLCVDSYFIDDAILKELADSRMDDLAQKIRYSSFASQLSNMKLNGRQIVIANSKEIKDNPKNHPVGTVYANQDYTNRGGATGIIELAVKLEKTYEFALKIQVQGEHYRHALEWLDTRFSCNRERMKELLNNEKIKPFFKEEAFDQVLFDGPLYPVTKKNDDIECEGNGFNHFGQGFQYRSKKIKKNSSLKQQCLLKHMIDDLESIVQVLNDSTGCL